MAALSLTLFGGLVLAVDDDGRRMPVTLAPRSAALLAVLALGAGRRFSRSELLQLLWQDDARGGSLACLNTALWRLRKSFAPWRPHCGELIDSDPQGGLALRADSALWLDVQEFQRLVAPGLGKPLEALEAADIEQLAAGVRLYRADLLVNFDADWALRERERLRRSFLNALGRLMRYAALTGQYDEAIRRAQRVLELDPLREDVHRDLMRYYVQNGQRALALRQFETCRGLLRRELAIAPMPETVALYQRLAQASLHVDGPSGVAAEPAATQTDAHAVGVVTVDPAAPPDAGRIGRARQLIAEADHQLQLFLGLP
ncbi:MAG: AfsR/SARP family transcriptional regulator [Silanimonas sp.]